MQYLLESAGKIARILFTSLPASRKIYSYFLTPNPMNEGTEEVQVEEVAPVVEAPAEEAPAAEEPAPEEQPAA